MSSWVQTEKLKAKLMSSWVQTGNKKLNSWPHEFQKDCYHEFQKDYRFELIGSWLIVTLTFLLFVFYPQKQCSTYKELIKEYPQTFTTEKLNILLGQLSGSKPVLSNSKDWSRQGWFEKKEKGAAESEQRQPHIAITSMIRQHEYILEMSTRQRS